jgi:hypoxanthine-guanine phosphoribosyltransferase
VLRQAWGHDLIPQPQIAEEFVYGCGLDWDERDRDLPFISLANP